MNPLGFNSHLLGYILAFLHWLGLLVGLSVALSSANKHAATWMNTDCELVKTSAYMNITQEVKIFLKIINVCYLKLFITMLHIIMQCLVFLLLLIKIKSYSSFDKNDHSVFSYFTTVAKGHTKSQ